MFERFESFAVRPHRWVIAGTVVGAMSWPACSTAPPSGPEGAGQSDARGDEAR